MKIEKAIELLKEAHKHNYAWRGSNLDTAIKLGIEALKRIRSARKLNPDLNPSLLPGETAKEK